MHCRFIRKQTPSQTLWTFLLLRARCWVKRVWGRRPSYSMVGTHNYTGLIWESKSFRSQPPFNLVFGWYFVNAGHFIINSCRIFEDIVDGYKISQNIININPKYDFKLHFRNLNLDNFLEIYRNIYQLYRCLQQLWRF